MDFLSNPRTVQWLSLLIVILTVLSTSDLVLAYRPWILLGLSLLTAILSFFNSLKAESLKKEDKRLASVEAQLNVQSKEFDRQAEVRANAIADTLNRQHAPTQPNTVFNPFDDESKHKL